MQSIGDMSIPDSLHYVSLSEDVTIFEPADTINSVFFDVANQQIFTLRSRGTMGVNVKSVNSTGTINFRIDDRGDVLSIKFSPNNKLLAIQRTLTTVNLLNFTNTVGTAPDGAEYSQSCKSKTDMLLGFVWPTSNEILFVTDGHLELYQVNPQKRSLRMIKQINQQCDWFCWDLASQILATAGPSGARCNAFQLKNPGVISKLARFDLPHCLHGSPNQPASEVLANNCLLATIYGRVLFFLVRKRTEVADNEDPISINVHLYELDSDGSVRLSDMLLVRSEGPIAISLVDNLILLHSQLKQLTFVYDISLEGVNQNGVTNHQPIMSSRSIAPLNLPSNAVPSLSSNLGAKIAIELYSANWIFNLPNVVIDTTLGCLWRLEINHHVISKLSTSATKVFDFLLNRCNGKQALLAFCSELATNSITLATQYESIPEDDYTYHHAGSLHERLDDFAYLFKRLGKSHYHTGGSLEAAYRIRHNNSDTVITSKGDESLVPAFTLPFLIDQAEVLTHIFSVLQGNENKCVRSFLYNLLVEYIRSLLDHELPVEYSWYELLVSTIARLEDYDQLSYCVQSNLLEDSKPIALQLLSLESVYPAAGQLAMDMLKRINLSEEEIVEILLLSDHVMEALRYCCRRPNLLNGDCDLAKRCLEIALRTNNRAILYNVFQFFRSRNDQSWENNLVYQELIARIGTIFGTVL